MTLNSFGSAVPQAADFLDPQPLAKGKTEKTKKKKETKNAQQQHQAAGDAGFMTVPSPSLHLGIINNNNRSITGSPAPRAGFSRIGSSSVIESSSTTMTAEQGLVEKGQEYRPKVAFGLTGVKRKAGEEALGTPPHKRR